jgi:zinc protease
MMSIFGGGGSASRLGGSLREMMGSTYGVRAGLWSTKVDRRIWAITSVQTDRTKEAIEEILAQARLLREADVSDEELSRARDGALAGLPARFDTVVGTLDHFVSLVERGLPADDLDGEASKLMAVDRAAVREAAQSYLAAERLRFVVVGDARLVMPRLRELVADGAALPGGEIQVVDGNGRPVAP